MSLQSNEYANDWEGETGETRQPFLVLEAWLLATMLYTDRAT